MLKIKEFTLKPTHFYKIDNIFTPDPKQYFTVGDQVFYNNIDALAYLTKNPSQQIKYNLDFKFIKEFDWKIEPPNDIHFYLKKHASIIAQKYNDIGITYSGGTDSHTVLDTFIQCGIKNITLINLTERTEKNFTWIDQKKPNNSLKKKYSFVFNELGYKEIGLTENYITLNPDESTWEKTITSFNGTWNSDINNQLAAYYVLHSRNPRLLTLKSNSCIVWGFEKPRLTIQNGWWCWQAYAGQWSYPVGLPASNKPDYSFFFITDDVPEIQVKLSWLKIKTLEEIIKNTNSIYNNYLIHELQSFSSPHYQRINKEMGYRAINHILNGNYTKDPGHLRINFTKELAEMEKKNNIRNITNEYFDTVIRKNIDEKYLYLDSRKTMIIASDPIPIKPVADEIKHKILET